MPIERSRHPVAVMPRVGKRLFRLLTTAPSSVCSFCGALSARASSRSRCVMASSRLVIEKILEENFFLPHRGGGLVLVCRDSKGGSRAPLIGGGRILRLGG